METTKFIINELGLQKQTTNELILKTINNQINNCKLEYISQ
jgi:hypothetical protein